MSKANRRLRSQAVKRFENDPSLAPQARALPIHAKSGRERGPLQLLPASPGLTCGDEKQRSARKNSCAAPTHPIPRKSGARWGPRLRRSIPFSHVFPALPPPLRAKTGLAVDPGCAGLNNSALRAGNQASDGFVCAPANPGHCPLSHLIRSKKSPKICQRPRAMCEDL